ncbi:MAG: hypothetical protein JW915_09325 [Chitinispirillaceae bacterium]|nr:hypothetical protein [Chitinispirillaceae bacterium]
MLLMYDDYDPDEVLMDVDSIDEFDTISSSEEEIDFENPLFVKSTLGDFVSENETISELIK